MAPRTKRREPIMYARHLVKVRGLPRGPRKLAVKPSHALVVGLRTTCNRAVRGQAAASPEPTRRSVGYRHVTLTAAGVALPRGVPAAGRPQPVDNWLSHELYGPDRLSSPRSARRATPNPCCRGRPPRRGVLSLGTGFSGHRKIDVPRKYGANERVSTVRAVVRWAADSEGGSTQRTPARGRDRQFCSARVRRRWGCV